MFNPFDNRILASEAIAALSRADAIGLLSRQITCLNNSTKEWLKCALTEAGIVNLFQQDVNQSRFEAGRISQDGRRLHKAARERNCWPMSCTLFRDSNPALSSIQIAISSGGIPLGTFRPTIEVPNSRVAIWK